MPLSALEKPSRDEPLPMGPAPGAEKVEAYKRSLGSSLQGRWPLNRAPKWPPRQEPSCTAAAAQVRIRLVANKARFAEVPMALWRALTERRKRLA
ncbi:hypothetical protein MRX96_008297 [Rhipicephalus microplus]